MFTVRLERIRELSATTRDFRFVRNDGKMTEYQPGQFFRFVFTDSKGEFERSYSLCNFEELYGGNLDLVVSMVAGGRATNYLFDCAVGIEADVTGPFGRLLLPDAPLNRLVMVATSVGLAPYMPMLRELESRKFEQVVLLLGVRDRSEFIYSNELLEYAERHGFFELRLCLSREVASAAYEYDGYVNEQLNDLSLKSGADFVLLCGNPNMIDKAWGYLRDEGFKAKQVVREKYVFAKEKKSGAKKLTEKQKRLIAEKMQKYSRG